MTARLLPVGTFVCLFRESLESDPLYQDLWLEGEVSDLSRSSAGHLYFSLRDDDGCLKCVMFRGQALRQHHPLRFGDQIVVHGGLSIYPRSGAIQLVADLVQPAGLGAASLELEYLRQRLEAEGLFDPMRKRPLPSSPGTIGVVTSLHGAAWHDIVNVVGRRYPLADLVLSPAQVQGAGAAESIVQALQDLLHEVSVDVVILARGGGASDDLVRVQRRTGGSGRVRISRPGCDRRRTRHGSDAGRRRRRRLCADAVGGRRVVRSLNRRAAGPRAIAGVPPDLVVGDATGGRRGPAPGRITPVSGIIPSARATRAQNRNRDCCSSHAQGCGGHGFTR